MHVYARFGHLVGRECIDLGIAAEELGYDGIVISDHVFFPSGEHHPYPYSDDGEYPFPPETPWPDVFVTLGALAAVTERLRFLTAVYVLALRHPLQTAKALGTVAAIAGDRVKLGVGIGWIREEFEVLGADFDSRGARTDEAIDVLRNLWRNESNEHRGHFFSFPAVRIEPRPAGPIPILIGGISPPALRRAVTHGDGYLGVSMSIAEAAELVARLRKDVAAAGRDPAVFEIAVMCPEAATADQLCALAETGIDILYAMPFPDPAKTSTSVAVKHDALRSYANVVTEFKRRTEGSRPAPSDL